MSLPIGFRVAGAVCTLAGVLGLTCDVLWGIRLTTIYDNRVPRNAGNRREA